MKNKSDFTIYVWGGGKNPGSIKIYTKKMIQIMNIEHEVVSGYESVACDGLDLEFVITKAVVLQEAKILKGLLLNAEIAFMCANSEVSKYGHLFKEKPEKFGERIMSFGIKRKIGNEVGRKLYPEFYVC